MSNTTARMVMPTHVRTPVGEPGPHLIAAGHGRSSCRTRAVSRVRWSRSGTLVAVREASA